MTKGNNSCDLSFLKTDILFLLLEFEGFAQYKVEVKASGIYRDLSDVISSSLRGIHKFRTVFRFMAIESPTIRMERRTVGREKKLLVLRTVKEYDLMA